MAYENTLFDTASVIEVDIDISEDAWSDLLENATAEAYYDCNVTVNGTTYEHVGLRAKGNTSLSMVASSDSDRYSFKIKFDEYVDGQSCDGLSKLVLNNNFSDAAMMKEALCYDMFAFLGADASCITMPRFPSTANIGAFIWRSNRSRNPSQSAITAWTMASFTSRTAAMMPKTGTAALLRKPQHSFPFFHNTYIAGVDGFPSAPTCFLLYALGPTHRPSLPIAAHRRRKLR